MGDADDLGDDIMVIAFRMECENAALRRLVYSMALLLPPSFMAPDERALLKQILENGESPNVQP